jgi:thiamine transport system permease protein
MEDRQVNLRVYKWALLALILAPLLGILKLLLQQKVQFDFQELGPPIMDSLLLGALSAIVTTPIGFVCAIGIAGSKRRHVLEILALLPSTVPTLFVLLSLLSLWSPFPFGWVGSVIGIFFTTVGLVSVMLSHAIIRKIAGLCEAAEVIGIRSFQFVFKIVLPLIRSELIGAASLVFVTAFSSFAIPFVLGAGKVKAMEFAIYQFAYQDQNYFPAILVGVFQFLILFALSGWTVSFRTDLHLQKVRFGLIHFWWAGVLAVLPVTVLAISSFSSAIKGFNEIEILLAEPKLFLQAWINTIALALTVGCVVVGLFRLSVFWVSDRWLDRFLLGLQSPSTVLLSLGVWGLLSTPISQLTIWQSGILTSLALVAAFFCLLYRFGWSSQIHALKQQIEVAQVLGLSEKLTANHILWPQMKPVAFQLGGLAALWACGDFTYSTLLSGQDWTLSLVAESLLSFYRINLAMILGICVLFTGSLLYLAFRRIGNVDHQGN